MIVYFVKRSKGDMNLWEKYLGDTYELVDVLKESGEGSVAIVYDRKAKQVCIMKQRSMRSKDLYRKLKAMKNPYVPRIYHMMEQESILVVIEEYIDGSTLEDYLEHASSQCLTEAEAVDILRQLCMCMEIFHRDGMIHRDIKPSNIMLTQDHAVRLIDFGIARIFNPTGVPDTEVLGTRGYAAPEQYGFGQTDARSDIYTLGITMRQALGKAYRGYLEKILLRCTAMDPDQRYQSATEILQDLQRKKNLYHAKRWGSILAAMLLLAGGGLYLRIPEHEQAIPVLPVQEPDDASSPVETAPKEVQGDPIKEEAPEKESFAVPEPVSQEKPENAQESAPSPVAPIQPAPVRNKHVESDVFIRGGEWQDSFSIDEATWRQWQRADGSVHLPSDWAICVHVENDTHREFTHTRGRLRVIRPDAEQDVIDDILEEGPVHAGETKDIVIPLSKYPLMRHTAMQFTFYLYEADGKRQPVADTIQTVVLLE